MIGHIAISTAIGASAAAVSFTAGASFPATIAAYILGGNSYLLPALALSNRGRRGRFAREGFEPNDAGYSRVMSKEKDKFRILAVDDDPLACEIIQGMLSEIDDVEVVTCPSAAAAQEIIRGKKIAFDCYFLDIEMPGMDGIDLAAWIRNVDGDLVTPIVMATAMTDRRNVTEAFRVGATDYVTKPFEMAEIEKRVADIRSLEPSVLLGNEKVDREQAGGRLTSIQSVLNYLAQLNRGGLFAANVFSVKVNFEPSLEASQDQPSRMNELAAISAAPEVLKALPLHRGSLLAYAGEGVFVGVINGKEADALAALDGMPPTLDVNGRKMGLSLQGFRSVLLPEPSELLDQAFADVVAAGKDENYSFSAYSRVSRRG